MPLGQFRLNHQHENHPKGTGWAEPCFTVPNGAPWDMRRGRPFQPADTKVMFAVRYEDGRSAYIRVSPEAARYGPMVVMSIAREQQKAGDIPDGTLVSVQQVR
jgi:hypothetical protein